MDELERRVESVLQEWRTHGREVSNGITGVVDIMWHSA
jgi:hypothetical protein